MLFRTMAKLSYDTLEKAQWSQVEMTHLWEHVQRVLTKRTFDNNWKDKKWLKWRRKEKGKSLFDLSAWCLLIYIYIIKLYGTGTLFSLCVCKVPSQMGSWFLVGALSTTAIRITNSTIIFLRVLPSCSQSILWWGVLGSDLWFDQKPFFSNKNKGKGDFSSIIGGNCQHPFRRARWQDL